MAAAFVRVELAEVCESLDISMVLSITIIPHEPIAVPHCMNDAESSGMSSTLLSDVVPSAFFTVNFSSQRRIFIDDPPGIIALNLRPGSGPPQRSCKSSPRVHSPVVISYLPGLLDQSADSPDMGAGVRRTAYF